MVLPIGDIMKINKELMDKKWIADKKINNSPFLSTSEFINQSKELTETDSPSNIQIFDWQFSMLPVWNN